MPYNPDQPRDPKGTDTGGQWTAGDAKGPIQRAASDDNNHSGLGYAP